LELDGYHQHKQSPCLSIIAKALGDIARAKGMTHVACFSGLFFHEYEPLCY